MQIIFKLQKFPGVLRITMHKHPLPAMGIGGISNEEMFKNRMYLTLLD